MKVYAIRIENGDTVVVTGESEYDALQNAGITEEVFGELREQGIEMDHATMVQNGFAPQRYEILELKSLGVILRMNEMGDLAMEDMDQATREQLETLYPILQAANSEINARWPASEAITRHREEYDRLIADARDRESMRLMMPRNLDGA